MEPPVKRKKLGESAIMKGTKNTIYWFRKALRLHDNPSLIWALKNTDLVYPIFILDPFFTKNPSIGVNRWRFLQQSLEDLDRNLRKHNSRLLLIQGQPRPVFEEKFKEWNITHLCFEGCTEPYGRSRDEEITTLAENLGIEVIIEWSHTLYNPQLLHNRNNHKVPGTYKSFLSILKSVGAPKMPAPEPEKPFNDINISDDLYKIPDLYSKDNPDLGPNLYPGGETEALKRLDEKLKNQTWVRKFSKPDTSPNSLVPSTTVLSPYMKFGCLSAKVFYCCLKQVTSKGPHTDPPVSLEGQLLWREFFYFNAAFTPNFDKMVGNPICKQIDWDENEEYLKAWKEARTGYPFIDAIMTQLKKEGWIHHLARHAVACFLTRGDLYISWEKGKDVFEGWLLDADWSMNAGNWLWLSASSFFYQYFRVYSPIAFGKKTDKNGDYIRKYVPILKNYPREFIYEPWLAPKHCQEKWGCVIGRDYPKPIVDHAQISKINMGRMKKAYSKSM